MTRVHKINRLHNVRSGTYLTAGVWARGEVSGWSISPDDNQRWQLIKIAGAYAIRNLELGTYLQWAGLKEGERVYYSDGPPSRWTVEEDGDRKIIVAEGTGLALDLHGGRPEGGTAINLHRRSDVSQQKWYFIDIDYDTGPNPLIAREIYRPKKVMPFPLPTVECYILSNLSGATLDLYGGKDEDGTPVIGCSTHRGNNQRWILVPAKTGFYVRNVASGTYLGFKEGEFVGQGTVVTCNHNQVEWHFYPKNDGWSLRCSVSPWLVLDVADNSHSDGCKMWLWPDNDGENQKWALTAAS